MGMTRQLNQYASRRMTRRLYRTMPWIGGALALLTLGGAIRRKGFLGGTLNTVLDFVPFVGGAKNFAEVTRGRDLSRKTAPELTGTEDTEDIQSFVSFVSFVVNT